MRSGKHFLIASVVLLFSCSKESDPGQDVAPKCLVTGYHDTHRVEAVTVDRNSDGNVIKVNAGIYDYSDELFYDASKRLIKVKRLTPPTDLHIIDITYDGSGRIQSATMYPEGYPSAAVHTNFTHDANGKLVKKEFLEGGATFVNSTRFEYSGDNVSVVYFKAAPDTEESIGVENLSFDSHQRFFSDDPSLRSYFIYVMGAEPSVNNLAHAKVTSPSPGGKYSPAADVTFDIQYDVTGKLQSYICHTSVITDQEYYLYNITYDCK